MPEAVFISSLNTPDLDARAIAAASVAGLSAVLGISVLSALSGTRGGSGRLLQAFRYSMRSGSPQAAARALLVCQVALSCTLVFGATLLVRSFVNLADEERGLDVRKVVTARVAFPAEPFATPAARAAAVSAMDEAARALPGVASVAWSYGMPPWGPAYSGDWVSDVPGAEPLTMLVFCFSVDRDFFDLYRIPILRGRAFRPSDEATAVLVSEHFARALWPGQEAIGRRFTFEQLGDTPFEVIGIVSDIHYPSLERAIDDPEIYLPFTEPRAGTQAMLNLRCSGACPDFAQVRRQLQSAHASVNVSDVAAPEARYRAQFERPRAAASLGSAFATIALVAAAAGLFSLFSQSVSGRRRELGIRTALGATPGHIRRLVWRESLTVLVIGISIGALASVALSRVLSSLLFGVTTADPMSWASVAFAIAVALAAAGWHPTRNAVRASPVALLRED